MIQTTDGSYVDAYTGDRLWHLGAGSNGPWLLKQELDNQLVKFNDMRRVTQISRPNGQSVHYEYPAVGSVPNHLYQPIRMKDDFGRSLELHYDSAWRLDNISDPSGQTIRYGYATPADLATYDASPQQSVITSVTYQDGSVVTYHMNEAAHVANPTPGHWLLTGITDAKGDRYATFKYNGTTPYSTEHANGADKFQITDSRSDGHGSVVVKDPVGSERSLFFTPVQEASRLISQSQPAGSGCNASSKSLSYDAQGNVASKTDFNGTTTVYTHDLSRNLEVRRVESSGQNTARTISTQWHPVWRLETRVAEPGLITTSVYNGQPDPTAGGATASCAPADALLPDGSPIAVLCKRIEQATLDANGSQGFDAAADPASPVRVWQYTYNRFGQTLTEDGPRTDVADITTHIYYADTSFVGSGAAAQGHTLGDLASTTDPSGQTTTYDLYNKHGQLLQSTDPNGIVSTYTYDLRQRLTSASVGGQTTTYTHDPVGQLIQVSLPDGSQVSHTYDPAHRLIASADHLGNRIDYTLDNAGNVIGQNLKDPNGALRHSLQQSRDALGRVQQTQTAQ